MSDFPTSDDPKEAVANALASLVELKRIAEHRAKRNEHLDLIDALFDSAQAGDSDDFKALVLLANNAALKVLELTQNNFESAREIAQQFQAWPSVLYQSKRVNDLMISTVTALELGKKSPFPVDLKMAFQRVTTQNPIAIFLLNITRDLVQKGHILSLRNELEARLVSFKRWATGKLRMFIGPMKLQLSNFDRELARLEISLRKCVRSLQDFVGVSRDVHYTIPEDLFNKAQQLPPLDETSIGIWADFGWEFLRNLTDDRPQAYPALRKFGIRHENKYLELLVKQRFGEVIEAEVENLRKLGVGEQSAESNIRTDIGTAIRDAYETVLALGENDSNTGE